MSKVHQAAEILSQSRSLLVLTGAGVSAESGIPTYRGPGGIYEETPSLTSTLTADNLREKPDEVWKHIDSLRQLVSRSRPNRAHEILAEWEGEGRFSRFLLATQNVDSLHTQAGSQRVTELHGNIWELAISRGHDYLIDEEFSEEMQAFESEENREELLHKWSRENDRIVWENRELPFPSIPPCGDAGVRPNILLFDEPYGNRLLWVHDFLRRDCDAVLVVGCSGGVMILDRLLSFARRQNPECAFINVNPHFDCLEGEHLYLQFSAVEGLEALDAGRWAAKEEK